MKDKYISKKYWEFKIPSLSKTNEMVKRYDDVIDLSIGDPDLPCDRGVIEGMCKDALEGHTKYTEFKGDEELREKICKVYKEDQNCDYDLENIIITAGGTHAMYITLEAILEDHDEIIVISPYYIFYEPQIEATKGKMVVYDTSSEDDFEIDLDEFEKVITSRTKAVIINSPNNPTGKVYMEETIKGMLDLANKYDFIIIDDDIYGALNYTDRKKSICSYDCHNPRIITIYSFSKDYSMTGFRLGYIVGQKRLIEAITKINEGVNFTINSMAQRAGIYALERRKEIQGKLYDEYKKRLFYIYDRIKNIKNMNCFLPEGTFYLFVDISQTNLTSEEIWEEILDEAHVLVLPGNGFGDAGEGYIRIACTSGIDVLKEAFDRIEKMDIFQ